MRDLIAPSLVVLGLSIPLWIAMAVAEQAVARRRVERFAVRHGLAITVRNGNQVIRYLTTTRRWRAFGLASGLVVSVLWFLPSVTVNSLYLFAGWFAGALLAELRVAHLPYGMRKAALVAPRRAANYLPAATRTLLPAATVLCVVAGVIAQAPLRTATGVLIAVLVWLVQRRVLHRVQPLTEVDEIAADDAIRSRSLHVLAGGGTALVLYCILGLLDAYLATLLGAVLIPMFGYLVATSTWRVARVP